MEIQPIRTEADYRRAVAEVEALMDAEEGTPEAERLDILATLVEAYEDRQWPINPPDPVSAIEFAMEQRGITRRKLQSAIGPRLRVSDILSRRRRLTLPMIWRLSRALKIPAELLIAPYALSSSGPRRAASKSRARGTSG